MAGLSFKNIAKVYENGVKAVSQFSLDIKDKEFVVLVGPSGCGKSTLLRMIAGLEEITTGELYINDFKVNDMTPKERDIAMVFQNYALYPHMSVYENMGFSLRLERTPEIFIEETIDDVAKVLNLEKLLERKPKTLSGGQRQRVALGRSMVRNPKVFLLDEPLSNLDAKLRVSMRAEIKNLHRKLNTTFIYVTHDQVEAMTMGTMIIVMKDGYIQQVADPSVLYEHPENVFVASFVGLPPINLYQSILNFDGKEATLELFGSKVKLPLSVHERLKTKDYTDKEVLVGLRPECIHARGENDKFYGGFKLAVKEYLGNETVLFLEGDKKFVKYTETGIDYLDEQSVMVAFKAPKMFDCNLDDIVDISVDLEKLLIFDKQTENTLLYQNKYQRRDT